MKQLLMRFGFIFIAVGLLFCSCNVVFAEGIVVIVNKDVPNSGSIDKEGIKKIFIGNKIKWSDNSKIKVSILADGEVHKQFLKGYVGRNAAQFKNTWRKVRFTGKGKIPKTFSSEEEILKYVADTKGAIGYMTEKSGDFNGVNIVKPN